KALTVARRWRRKAALVVPMLLFTSATNWASVIVGWDFSPITASDNWGASPYAPANVNAGVTLVGLTRNWAINGGTPAASAWGGNNFSTTATSRDLAIAANNFVTFTITVKAGFQMSLSDIAAYNIRRSSSGPTTGIWQYQIGGGAFSDIGSPITW